MTQVSTQNDNIQEHMSMIIKEEQEEEKLKKEQERL